MDALDPDSVQVPETTFVVPPDDALSPAMRDWKINAFEYISRLPRDALTPSVDSTPEAAMRTPRQVKNAAYSFVVPEIPPDPKLVCVAPSALRLFDLPVDDADAHLASWTSADRDRLVAYLSGFTVPPGAQPWAHCYAGFQFGSFAGQLGDGRAISLGEYRNAAGESWELQLKGAGNTPYSRFGDGFAVLRSSIREFLCSEHFAALGIPTSRAVSLIATGQPVVREKLEPGAVVARAAPSWLRFGSFEVYAMRGDVVHMAQVAKFALDKHFPAAQGQVAGMLAEVADRTAKVVALWDLVAWEHGVLNTDNMSLLGLTIDFGPYGFLDAYDPDHPVNHSDHTGRYSLRNQRAVGLWNLAKLANALVELVGRQVVGQSLDEIAAMMAVESDEERAKFIEQGKQAVVDAVTPYEDLYDTYFQDGMRKKLGLVTAEPDDHAQLIQPLLSLLEAAKVDYTVFFRTLSSTDPTADIDPLAHFFNRKDPLACGLPKPGTPAADLLAGATRDTHADDLVPQWHAWRATYAARIAREPGTADERVERMKKANPKFVLRQWIAQATIEAAEKGEFEAVAKALAVMTDPYADVPRGAEKFGPDGWWEEWAREPPAWGVGLVCSCSS
ncbi:hypothetical protein GGF31_006034 [Allomyces arbusculus]|nr:hypothetical protein GGF31_006034 [Allomyces arbusculus]